ncbi:hypothetical protein DQ384_35640 [Sphaerisporangium album]|uniref:Uncharacterized protein n=1 Tax=Sphaerisporangium album TaxID=509200 RepID=A0A367EWD4_9ACTN|nr:hypothetical protein [Sphaerisporangium album]RCG22444.1 hypothetical protein DQ384_35640 [Sphaerisporangium album]
MPSGPLSDAEPSARAEDLHQAGVWLARHGMADAPPTPLLATRLAVRRRARRADRLVLAALIIAAALAQAYDRLSTSAFGGYEPHRPMPLLLLTALTAGLLLVQALLGRWVRRVDRRAGHALRRRAAHPVQPGWRAVLGRPYALFASATFAGAAALALSALTVQDSTVRYAAFVLLVGLFGVGAGVALQLRDLLARPVVAEDETSLTADVIMRVEDARELATPTVLWALPVVLLFGSAPGWWNGASLVFVVAGLVTCAAIQARTPPGAAVARRAMSAR